MIFEQKNVCNILEAKQDIKQENQGIEWVPGKQENHRKRMPLYAAHDQGVAYNGIL